MEKRYGFHGEWLHCTTSGDTIYVSPSTHGLMDASSGRGAIRPAEEEKGFHTTKPSYDLLRDHSLAKRNLDFYWTTKCSSCCLVVAVVIVGLRGVECRKQNWFYIELRLIGGDR